MGQAYPLALAWGMAQHQHVCCCSGIAEPCHCDHSKQHGKVKACHEDPLPRYAPLPCGGGKTEAQSLSFQGDPFLPRMAQDPLATFRISTLNDLPNIFLNFIPRPDPRPPKAIS